MNVRTDPRHLGDNGFGDALRREAGLPMIVTKRIDAKPMAAIHPPLPVDALAVGVAETGGDVGLRIDKLVEGRLLIQGASGAGKSWALRRILEQSDGAIQRIVLDPEGEFASLVEAKGLARIDASALDIATLATAAGRVRAHRLSVLLDLSDCDREAQMIAATAFLRGLIDAPREDWHAAMVVVDEAHLLAPFGADAAIAPVIRKAAVGALSDLMSRGRKRGLCGIVATQRLSRLAKSVASEAMNFLIGANTLDLDIRRAAETIGWDARKAFDRLPMLSAGNFVATGPAFTRSPSVLKVGPVETAHRGAAPAVAAPTARTAAEAADLLGIAALAEETLADAETRSEASRPESVRSIRAFIRQPGFALAARVYESLVPLAPAGARLRQVAKEFGVSLPAIAEACVLLDRYGVLEFSGAGDARVARIAVGFKP